MSAYPVVAVCAVSAAFLLFITAALRNKGDDQGCRPFSTENEHTGSFSGRSEPQDDTGDVVPSGRWNGLEKE